MFDLATTIGEDDSIELIFDGDIGLAGRGVATGA